MRPLQNRLKDFARGEDGSQSIEFMVMAPLLAWAIVSMLAFTDVYRTRAMASDATAVVADTLSRQTTPIDDKHLSALRSVVGKITRQEDGVKLRITQIRCTRRCGDGERRSLEVSFSKGKGLAGLESSDFKSGALREKIPMLSRGDRIVLVETLFTHKPILNTGLKESEVNMFQTTRMRFAPQLCWEKCDL